MMYEISTYAQNTPASNVVSHPKIRRERLEAAVNRPRMGGIARRTAAREFFKAYTVGLITAAGAGPDDLFFQIQGEPGSDLVDGAGILGSQLDSTREDGLQPTLKDGDTKPDPFLGQLLTTLEQKKTFLQAGGGVLFVMRGAIAQFEGGTGKEWNRYLHGHSPHLPDLAAANSF